MVGGMLEKMGIWVLRVMLLLLLLGMYIRLWSNNSSQVSLVDVLGSLTWACEEMWLLLLMLDVIWMRVLLRHDNLGDWLLLLG